MNLVYTPPAPPVVLVRFEGGPLDGDEFWVAGLTPSDLTCEGTSPRTGHRHVYRLHWELDGTVAEYVAELAA